MALLHYMDSATFAKNLVETGMARDQADVVARTTSEYVVMSYSGLATKADIEGIAAKFDAKFGAVDGKFSSIDAKFAAIEAKISSESAITRAAVAEMKWTLLRTIIGVGLSLFALYASMRGWRFG